MEKLGYARTWKTKCFLTSACHTEVWAHTNGNGDFVLFDGLGGPWQIHECSFQAPLDAGRSRNAGPRAGAPAKDWEFVVVIEPETNLRQPRRHFIGTVTSVVKGFSNTDAFRSRLSGASTDAMRKVLDGRTTSVTVVTGEGAQYSFFMDTKKTPTKVHDTVACDIKVQALLNVPVFVATKVSVVPPSAMRQ